jgi:hypothetical protein
MVAEVGSNYDSEWAAIKAVAAQGPASLGTSGPRHLAQG